MMTNGHRLTAGCADEAAITQPFSATYRLIVCCSSKEAEDAVNVILQLSYCHYIPGKTKSQL